MSETNQQTKSSLSWKEMDFLEEQINSINYNKYEKSLKDEIVSRVNKSEGETSWRISMGVNSIMDII